MTPPILPRRRFLQRGAALGGAAALATLGTGATRAADYKALVCVFLYGGNDGMNCVVPTDSTRHAAYAAVRGPLALPRANLVDLPGSDYGLHPALSALQPMWAAGQLAPVFNVGPLQRPLTKAEYLAAPDGADYLPDSLFSHADQQILWECATADALTRTGWGGRGSATLGTVNPVISVGGNGRFGVEPLRSPLVVPGPGSVFGAYGLRPEELAWTPNRLRREAIDALYAQPQGSTLGDAYRAQQGIAFEISERLAALVAAMPGSTLSSPQIDAAFAPLIVDGALTTPLAGQLYQVAKLVRANAIVQGSRQMFFAQQGGYDTHFDQIGGSVATGTHAALLKQLGDAMAAFQRAMDNLGMSGQVTLFTQSDFGRTFVPNSSRGTDHAWGNHQLVMGGAVRGGATYGQYPSLVVGGPDDVGVEAWELQGRWIPTSSVDQYAATLLGWFGADATQLDAVLPNLGNFGATRSLGFL